MSRSKMLFNLLPPPATVLSRASAIAVSDMLLEYNIETRARVGEILRACDARTLTGPREVHALAQQLSSASGNMIPIAPGTAMGVIEDAVQTQRRFEDRLWRAQFAPDTLLPSRIPELKALEPNPLDDYDPRGGGVITRQEVRRPDPEKRCYHSLDEESDLVKRLERIQKEYEERKRQKESPHDAEDSEPGERRPSVGRLTGNSNGRGK